MSFWFYSNAYDDYFTCSAWRIFREAGERVHGCEAGAYRLHPTLVNGKVNITRSTGLQHCDIRLETRVGLDYVTIQNKILKLEF